MNYVCYHLHSQLSLLDSCTKYSEYVNKAKECGMTAMAFSEHGNIFEYYHKKCAIEEAGMKYIHAVEAYVTESLDNHVRDNYHVWLGAKNYEGFLELNELVSHSFNRDTVKIVGDDSRYYFDPRITFDDIIHTSDNIIITTACIGGILYKGNDNIRQRFIDFLVKNKHRCFLEIQHHNVESQKKYNQYLYDLSLKTGLRLIAGTDTHALNEKHIKGRTLLQKSKGISFADEDGWDLTFKTYDELVAAYKLQNVLPEEVYLEAINNTNAMADMVEPFELTRETKYPHIYDNPIDTFKTKINQAYNNHKYLKARYPVKDIKDTVKNELDVYIKTRSIDFMLLQVYLREWEHRHGIQCGYGRGSVSGSEIAYILGITEMDSKKFNLNFFRFMNPSRVTNADIDSDYGEEDRLKVKEFLLKDHMDLDQIQCAEIITFNTIALKGAIRDVCRGLYADKDPNYLQTATYICDNVEQHEDQMREEYPDVFEYVDILNGTIVSVGSHPSGVLVTDIDLSKKIGMCSLKTSNYPVSMLNMKELDALMYVKLDILGLDNIAVINKTCESIGIERLTPDNVDLNDEQVWKSIRDDTTLIFQWESDSAQDYLKRFMSDKTIEIAKQHNPDFSWIKWFSFGNGLIRPGCASFRDNVADGEVLITGFKELDDFLSITFGRITMQEDIMRFLVKFCGYSDAESDTVRRGIAKKYGTEKFIDEIHARFLQYSHDTYNVDVTKLEEIFPPIKQGILDATAYAFSWNHSDSYSCTGYICGYLRYYYPLEFLTAAFNIFTDKEDKILTLTEYAKKKGIEIRNIKFRHAQSQYTYDKDNNVIYKGMGSIKYMSSQTADELYSLRDKQYNSFTDLLIDLQQLSIDSRQLEILIKLDYFSEFGHPNQLLKQMELVYNICNKKVFKIDKLADLQIPVWLCQKYAGKQTEKQFSQVDTYGLLTELLSTIEYPKTTVAQRIQYQQEYLGYIQLTVPKTDEKYYFVQAIDNNWITLYQIKTGNQLKIKCRKKTRDNNPFEAGQIIKVLDISKEPRYTKDAEGNWVRDTEHLEDILSKYSVLQKSGT